MPEKSKTVLIMIFSLLFAVGLLSVSVSESAWAIDSKWDEGTNGSMVHADPGTFQKNYVLSASQKEYTIQECEKVVSAMETVKPDMSDLEKYFALALWANQRVEYDWKFWHNKYHFEYYSHQWDAYGAMNEDEKSVCVGIAIFYSNLCHAADLPCRFVRLNPDYLDHTINYIPDINGNAYYVDLTENIFLMSGESTRSFEPEVDKDFSYIPDEGPGSCIDTTFDYRDEEGDDLDSSNIKDFYNKNTTYDEWFGEYEGTPTYEEWFREYVNHQAYEKWFRQYALHDKEVTDQLFEKEYEEKGSGLPGTDLESYHAAYHAYRSNFTDPTADPERVWFLDDFFENPADVKAKILENRFDAQLLDVSGLEDNYNCDTVQELETAVAEDITVKYFPTCVNGEIVAESADLIKGVDYEVTYKGHDDQAKDEVFSIDGIGAYKGTHQIHVKMRSAAVVKAPVAKKDLVYNGEPLALVEPGEAADGEMQYGIGTKTEAPEAFASDIPTAVNAGKYYVWYKVAGDESHEETQAQHIRETVSIAPMKVYLILENMDIKVGETGVISPKFDVDKLNKKIPATFSYENWNDDIVSVTEDGVVKGLKKGNALIFVDVNPKYASPNYDFASRALIVHVSMDAVDIDQAKVVLSESAFTYNGKVQKPSIKTVKGLELEEGTDYTAAWSDASSENAGNYTVTIEGKGNYTGTTDAAYTIKKAENPITLKAKAVKIRYKSLKKSSKSIKPAKAFTVSNAKGKPSYKLASAKKDGKSFKNDFSVNAKTGKVTVKKGLEKGTYKVKVKIKAEGNANYRASVWKAVTFKVRVK